MARIAMVVAVLLVLCTAALGYDPGMHMYLGSKTFDFWSNYDSSFYGYLTMPDNNYWGMMTRKYYYIGLTIPDLLLPAQEGIVRTIVGMLYHHRSTGIDSALGQYYGEVGTLPNSLRIGRSPDGFRGRDQALSGRRASGFPMLGSRLAAGSLQPTADSFRPVAGRLLRLDMGSQRA